MDSEKESYQWVLLFRSENEAAQTIPVGKLQLVEAKGLRICIAHTPNGWFAIRDECPHLAFTLSKGHLNAFGEVICPWHSYRYQLKNGEECQGRSRAATTYPIEIRLGKVVLGVPIKP